MGRAFKIGVEPISLKAVFSFVFQRDNYEAIEITSDCRERIEHCHARFLTLLESGIPIYGVTTGFGDSCHRTLPPHKSEQLQRNLVSFLICGSGERLPRTVSRAVSLLRLLSITRGYSSVSLALVEQMKQFLERDWLPVIPREGSLGASGDLIPLAYLAQILLGDGEIETADGLTSAKELLTASHLEPYHLKPKEGLAIVNGTSAMAGLSLVNLNHMRFLLEMASVSTAWLCMAIRGREEAFGTIVNEMAKKHLGQLQVAKQVRAWLKEESYECTPIDEIPVNGGVTDGYVQDRYSLRCAPQILGPIWDTVSMVESWLEQEINGASDNPLMDDQGKLATGGNFYGGYLAHGMDYLKICIGNMADMIDRQLMILVDDKSNRGLPPNLANWKGLPESEHFLHHGLKGIHQAVNAITSEIQAKTMANSVFSRSSELHNQDKVSLGMSAAVQCSDTIEALFTITGHYLVCLAQALDLRGITLEGATSKKVYGWVREAVPFVDVDMPLEGGTRRLRAKLQEESHRTGTLGFTG